MPFSSNTPPSLETTETQDLKPLETRRLATLGTLPVCDIGFVSSLTTLTFIKLYIVGDTGLKTGWVRCRNGAGGAEGRGGVGHLGDTMVQELLFSSEVGLCVRLVLS